MLRFGTKTGGLVVDGRTVAGVAGSKLAEDMHTRLLRLSCVV